MTCSLARIATAMLPCCVALAPLSAQSQTVVSPLGTATADGNAAHNFPWLPNNATPASAVNVQRYMQIHSDLGTGVKLIKQLAFRRNGTSPTQAGTRAIDLELTLGSSVDYDKCSWVYANNWVGVPTKVVTRQVLNIGPLSGAGSPAPFEVVIPITPFVHLGTTSLAWDAQIYGNVETPPLLVPLDSDTATATVGLTPPSTGAGCVATGQTSAMSLVLNHQDSAGTYVLSGYVEFAPASAPVYLALGTANPSLPVPGLCSPLFTDLTVVLLLGVADATGFLGVTSKTGTTVTRGSGGPLAFATSNAFAGNTLYLQAHALDAGSSSPLPIANSNGRAALVPASNATKVVRVTRLFHTDGGPTSPWATSQPPLAISIRLEPTNVGYGVVTEFTY